MSPDKKPADESDWVFFGLGAIAFFVVLFAGLVLVTDSPAIYKIIIDGILIGAYIVAIYLRFQFHIDPHYQNESFMKLVRAGKTSSFFNGLGLSFLLFIVLFFGGMVWAVWPA